MAGKKKKKAVTDLTSEDTLDYIYLSDAMYPRLSGQGRYQNTQQTISKSNEFKRTCVSPNICFRKIIKNS